MKKLLLGCLTIATLFHMGSASADSTFALGLKGGTTGVGLDVIYPVNNRLNLRTGVSGFMLSRDFTEEGIKYDADVRLLTVPLFADVHPFGGAFRLTAGGVLNFNQLEGKASGTLLIDNTSYPASITATVDWNTFAPYVGLGWGHAFRGGPLSLTSDFGVLLTGSPNVSIKGTVDNPALQAAFANDLQQEAANLERELSNLNFFPVAAIGLSYRF